MIDFAPAHTDKEAFQIALDAVVGHIQPERALVLYGYDADDLLVPQVSHGLELMTVYTTGEVSLGILQEVLEGEEPQILVDAMTDPRYGERTSTVLSGIRSVICCPLMDADGSPIGLLYGDSRVQVAAFRQEHLRWLKNLAEQLQARLAELNPFGG